MTRDRALDNYKGIAVILMVVGNILANAPNFPEFFKHAPDIGFTIADVIAPMFIFAIAATYGQSFNRRFQIDKQKTYVHFVNRYFALLGIGALFCAGGAITSQETAWGVLQAIGVAGLITLMFIRFPGWARFALAGVLLIMYQYLLDAFLLDGLINNPTYTNLHGGLFGSVSWGAMLILSTAMIDLHKHSKKRFLIGSGILTAVAIASLFIVPISKNRVSLSYVLVATAISCAAYYAVEVITKILPKSFAFVESWGESPILMYVLHLILMGIARIPFYVVGIEARPLWADLLVCVFVLAALSLIALKLHKKNVKISL